MSPCSTIIAVTALRDVLLKEIDALKHSKTAMFMDLQDEKLKSPAVTKPSLTI